MNTRRIIFPARCLPTEGGKALAGLVEWLVMSLGAKGILDTQEGCELVQAVLPRLLDLVGEKQDGQSLDVTEAQWEQLRVFARPSSGLAPDTAIPLSACLIALYTALVVKEPS